MRLMRKVLLSAVVIFAAFQAGADVAGPDHLWRIEKDGKVFYLLGSLHNFPWKSLDPAVQRVVEGADKIVTETNEAESQLFLLFNNPMVLPEGQSLDRMLTPQAWQSLLTLLKDKVPVEMLKSLSPFAAAQEVLKARQGKIGGEDVQALEAKLSARSGEMEASIREIAKLNKTKTSTLDSAKGLSAVFSLPVESLEKLLLASDQELHNEVVQDLQQRLELIGKYANNDIDAVKDEMNASSLEHRKRLYTDRNREWLPKIEGLGDNKTLFVVGSGHLYGREGLIALLRDKGYRISPAVKPVGRCLKLFAGS